jgi:hypothetical protein
VKVSVTGSLTATAVELAVKSETGSADAVPAKDNASADANRIAANPLTWVVRRFMVFAYLFFEGAKPSEPQKSTQGTGHVEREISVKPEATNCLLRSAQGTHLA